GMKPEERREGARDREVRAEVEPEQERARVQRRLRREEHGGREIVDEERSERGDRCGGRLAAGSKQLRGDGPRSRERAEAGCESEEQREDAHVQSWADASHRRRDSPSTSTGSAGFGDPSMSAAAPRLVATPRP